MARILDSRQVEYRSLLQQLFPNAPKQLLNTLLQSIDMDLTSPLRVDASATPDLVVSIGPSIVSNTVSGRQKSIPHIQSDIPAFVSGTVTFPSADAGTIVVSPGSNLTLTCPSNNYVKALLCLDSTGQLVVTLGTPNAVEANADVPSVPANTLEFCYVTLFNNAGTIDPIDQTKIYQLSGGGSGGSTQAGFAQEVSLGLGDTFATVVFPTPLPGSNYVTVPSFVNLVDSDPQFQDITITNKTNLGFTATWNAPLDSANYSLGYIVPVVQELVGEASIPASVDNIVVTIPMPQVGTNYVVIATLVNIVDGTPQFQTVDITGKTNTTFTASWNAPTDSADYRLAFHLAQYQ